MKFYIASKVNQAEPAVNELKREIENLGHEIIYDWTENIIPKPFKENIEAVSKAAEDMANAVMNCDALIVLCAKDGLGMHIETGGALVASIILSFIKNRPEKNIYVVGKNNDRSVFYFHKSVKRVSDIPTLITILKQDFKSF
ncbi:MAG: hypothetical protein ABIJ60_00925 [Patescibacteria group bacterium]|nr:hypothetical protein [Patescibacteria group bacterium]